MPATAVFLVHSFLYGKGIPGDVVLAAWNRSGDSSSPRHCLAGLLSSWPEISAAEKGDLTPHLCSLRGAEIVRYSGWPRRVRNERSGVGPRWSSHACAGQRQGLEYQSLRE